MRGPTYRKLSYDGRHDLENFSIPSIRNVAVVVDQYGIQQRWDNVRANHLEIICLLYIGLNELQNLFLDGS